MVNINEFMEILSNSGYEFPYTDFNKVNLDWICSVLREFLDTLQSGGFAMPSGGTTGQVLGKLSDDDYNAGWIDQSGGGGGTTNYNQLTNKPKINNVELSGSKTAEQLGLVRAEDLSGYALKSWVESQGYIIVAPVQSVNGQTGAVLLDADDVGAVSTDDYDPDAKTAAMTQSVGVDANGKLWAEPSSGGGALGAYELIGTAQTVSEEGVTEIEWTQGLDACTDFVIGVNYDMLTYGAYSPRSLVSQASTKLGVYVNGTQILLREGVGTNAIAAVFAFSRNGGIAIGKNGNSFRTGWLAGGGDTSVSPPVSGTISSIKLSILTSGSEFNVYASGGSTGSIFYLFGR